MEIEENQLTHSEYLVCLEKFGIKWPNSNHLQGLFPFMYNTKSEVRTVTKMEINYYCCHWAIV